MSSTRLTALACLFLVACGGRVEADGTDVTEASEKSADAGGSGEAPTDGGGAPESGGGWVGGETGTTPSAGGCHTPLSGRVDTPTKDVFLARLIGVWTLCSKTSVFGTKEAGLEIAADGRWYKLLADGAGGLKRANGFGHEGRWSVIDTSSMNGPGSFQLNLEIDGSGTVITHPQFAETPRGMRLNNNGVFVGDYIR